MRKLFGFILILLGHLLLGGGLTSCVSVKEYQKMYLNDKDMALQSRKIESYDVAFQSYREGAAGATDGRKSGGGCGCN
jgi:hypothetical protein